MTQHTTSTRERWARFSLDRQILNIGSEMLRGSSSCRPEDRQSLRASYARVLELVDLTVETQGDARLRRELLRWRETIVDLASRGESDEAAHRRAFRSLLELDPESAKQIPLLGL